MVFLDSALRVNGSFRMLVPNKQQTKSVHNIFIIFGLSLVATQCVKKILFLRGFVNVHETANTHFQAKKIALALCACTLKLNFKKISQVLSKQHGTT